MWDTLWRTILVFLEILLFVVLLVWAVLALSGRAGTEHYTTLQLVAATCIMLTLIAGLLAAGFKVTDTRSRGD